MAPLFQNTEFTCGPACLRMAMQRLSPESIVKDVNEFLIWREANSIFMGHGHPGCTHYGLARSAVKRGFTADIYSDNLDVIERQLQKDVLLENEKAIFNLVHDHDRRHALQEGIALYRQVFGETLLSGLITAGKVPLMLVRAFIDEQEHWVLIDQVRDGIITVIDPYEKHTAHPAALLDDSPATHSLPLADFEQYCLHGDDRAYLILAIGRPA